MFLSIFLSKNQKLVKHWKSEHKQIVALAKRVIDAYQKKDYVLTKKELVRLDDIAIDHLMSEDIEFYRLLKNHTLDGDSEDLIHEFKHTFHDTKVTLMKFLSLYSHTDAELDDTFFETFNQVVAILLDRIRFEESNLYLALSDK